MIHPETPVGEMGERVLLQHLRSRIPTGDGVVLGIGDDAAAVETAGVTLITTDCQVEGIHFRREWSPPRLIGRKALNVNLSDIAAMAGTPRHATVSLVLRAEIPLAWVDGLYDGLLERAAEAGVSLVGGNVSGTGGPIVVDVAVLGRGDRLLRRSGAVAGDQAVVTGTLGAAAEGLRLLAQGARLTAEGGIESTGIWTPSSTPAVLHCLRAQLDPSPPLSFARALAEQELAHAGIDLSDGLSGDLLNLCEASELAAWLDPTAIPVDTRAAALERALGGEALSLALHGGEDYQLLLAVPPDQMDALRELAKVWELPLTVVGEFIAGAPEVYTKQGESLNVLPTAAHDHFRTPRPTRRPAPAGEGETDPG